MLKTMAHVVAFNSIYCNFTDILDIRAHADPNLGMMNEIKVLTKMIKNLQTEMANQVCIST